jgi:hypothetical protein
LFGACAYSVFVSGDSVMQVGRIDIRRRVGYFVTRPEQHLCVTEAVEVLEELRR